MFGQLVNANLAPLLDLILYFVAFLQLNIIKTNSVVKGLGA